MRRFVSCGIIIWASEEFQQLFGLNAYTDRAYARVVHTRSVQRVWLYVLCKALQQLNPGLPNTCAISMAMQPLPMPLSRVTSLSNS